MKCPYCGERIEPQLDQCLHCKASLKNLDLVPNLKEDKLLYVFKDKLFLIICILMIAATVVGIIDKNFPIIPWLFAAALWRTFWAARKDYLNKKSLKFSCGTIRANYIVTNVLCIMVIVLGLFIAVLLAIAMHEEPIDLKDIFATSNLFSIFHSRFAVSFVTKFPGLFFATLFIVTSLNALIPNLIFIPKIHAFAKSVCQNNEDESIPVEYTLEARNGLYILSAISLTGLIWHDTILGFVYDFLIAIAGLFAAILINKYYIKNNS